eukprot:CAMPEP_0202445604 /NCGR_PEP_ID=MMETSP1360-20130828/4380_1 /ASSEMBLY_ACC=CAM_ASM_000848 /TAXON_ID=515479 /ORGANISM="Licmophora paradoxa, Strain CCMP2313" /LENGTH=238 /DNA_ID=CAMNT_0049061919 /DNA_START=30 /DNA_END=746 /DNA_ORIENTATION=+
MTESPSKEAPSSFEATTTEGEFEVIQVGVAVVGETQEMDRDGAEQQHCRDQEAIMGGACVAGGCIGCLVCGPIWACALGAVSGYLTTRESAAGDAARSMGQLAISCRTKAIDLDEKHRLVDKTKAAAGNCWESVKDVNQKHKVVERTQSCCVSSWQGVKAANEKYKIAERTAAGIGAVCEYLNTKLVGTGDPVSTTTNVASVSGKEANFQEVGESRIPEWHETRKGSYAVLNTKSDTM